MLSPNNIKDGPSNANVVEPGYSPLRHDLDFFKGILQVSISAGELVMPVPLFYYDFTSLVVVFITPIKQIRKLLPSPLMHPLRLTPWHSATIITAFEYRDTDIGPYCEVGVAFPITLHRPAPVLTGFFKQMAGEPILYIWQLPVSTEAARYWGVRAGFPKFVADIQFDRHAGFIECRVAEENRHIFTLSVKEIPCQDAGRARLHCFNFQDGRILRLESNSNLRCQGISRNPSDVRLELGTHSVANELYQLGLGRMMQYAYCPESQMVLSSVLESFGIE